MQRVTIHAAKTNLSRLIEAALAGEGVVISRGNTPVVRLVPVIKEQLQIGILAEQLGAGPDFLAPLDDQEAVLWGGGA